MPLIFPFLNYSVFFYHICREKRDAQLSGCDTTWGKCTDWNHALGIFYNIIKVLNCISVLCEQCRYNRHLFENVWFSKCDPRELAASKPAHCLICRSIVYRNKYSYTGPHCLIQTWECSVGPEYWICILLSSVRISPIHSVWCAHRRCWIEVITCSPWRTPLSDLLLKAASAEHSEALILRRP